MKKIYIIIIIVSLFNFHFESQAKGGVVQIDGISIDKVDEEIVVAYQIIVKNFSSDDRLHITPVLFNGEGKWQRLQTLVLVGKRRSIYDLRTDIKHDFVKIIKRSDKNETINCQTRFPYEDWMRYVSVRMDKMWEGCCTNIINFGEVVSESVLLGYDIKPFYDIRPLCYDETLMRVISEDYILPSQQNGNYSDLRYKARDSSGLAVGFKVGSAIIDPNFRNNKPMLDSLVGLFGTFYSDPLIRLKSVRISGYASPEGSLYRNIQLSSQRAEAVKTYILKNIQGIDESLFEIRNGREDWEGLRKIVESSNIDYKNEILNIIDSYSKDLGIRKKKLMELRGGIPYNYMLRNFYPSLRSGGFMQIKYEIDRIGRINSLTQALEQNWIEAVEYMLDDKFDSALELLLELKEYPTVWNNIGVCYMMKGMYNQAEIYFLKATNNGDPDAQKNMDQINWIKQIK